MLKNISFKDPFTVASVILLLGFFSLIGPLSNSNIIFWAVLCLINYLNSQKNYRFKFIFKIILLVLCLYIQFIFDFKTITKEFFVHILGLLMIFKYFELDKDRDYFFYINLSFFISIISLLDGQDLVSSMLSFSITFFGIYLLYIINQIEFPEFKLKNFLKILGFCAALIPFVVVTYIVFPRTNINLNLLKSSQNKIGIPESITLGSFESISNSREKVFDVDFENQKVNQKNLYFRVKVFDILKKNKEWVQSPKSYLNQFFFEVKSQSEELKYKIVIKPHGKNWIPLLDYSHQLNSSLIVNPYNFTATNKVKIQNSKIINLINSNKSFHSDIGEKAIKFYLKLPNQNFKKLNEWVKKNNNGTQKEFIGKVLNKLKNDEYFYTLTPKKIGNDYEEFFFKTKEGYCEHYAGVFVILSRLAGIPARIVTGYYGGEYNEIGNFYTFRQSDAHSWTEVFLKNDGWVRVDPTNVIPLDRVSLNNNIFIENQIYNTNENSKNININKELNYQLRNIFKYFTYIDYRWTQFFLSYDKEKQKKIFRKIDKLSVKTFNIFITLIFVIIAASILIFIRKVKSSSFILYEIEKILFKNKIIINNHDTYEDLFNYSMKIKNSNIISNCIKFYVEERLRNKRKSIFQKIKVFFLIKKIALTN